MIESHRKPGFGACAVICIFAGIIGGCVTSTTVSTTVTHTAVPIPVNVLNTAGDVLPVYATPGDLALTLGAIPGSIWGHSSRSSQFVPIGHQQSILLDIDDLSAKIGRQATQLSEAESAFLQITPKDTRFVRVATGVWFTSNHPVTLNVGFIDADTGDTLTLVYFDRACRLAGTSVSGTTPTETRTTDFDVDVEHPGWVWIVTKRDGPLHAVNSRAVRPHALLVVSPPEARSHGRFQKKSE